MTYKLTVFGTLETYFENSDIIEKWNDFEQKEIEKWRDISVNYDILEKHVHKLYEIQIDEEGFSTEDILMVLRILLELDNNSNIVIKNKQSIIKEFDFNPYIPKERLVRSLDFLILTNQNVKELIENKSIVKKDFIPIGEIKKRPSRYNLKPLILLDENTIAYEKSSLRRSFNVWGRAFSNAKYPFVSLNENINSAIKGYQKEVQDYLANEVEEVLLSINQNIKIFKETHFYKLDKIGKYKRSDEVGDYDILAFDLDKNIIFNIECKYGSQPFNAKEAKNAKNDFLKKKKGYKVKFEKRIEYLEKEAHNLLKNMYDIESELEIVNIYLPYTLHMYHFFENETQSKIKYMTKNMLKDYVVELYN